MKKKTNKTKYTVLTIAIIILGGYMYVEAQGNTVIAVFDTITPVAYAKQETTAREVVDMMKEEVLDSIAECETKNSTSSDGIITFDTNEVASVGRYQFQIKTIIVYYKMYYNQNITSAEAIMVAIDPVKSRELAKHIAFGDDKAVGNWHNCADKHGLYEKVKIIKEIESKIK